VSLNWSDCLNSTYRFELVLLEFDMFLLKVRLWGDCWLPSLETMEPNYLSIRLASFSRLWLASSMSFKLFPSSEEPELEPGGSGS